MENSNDFKNSFSEHLINSIKIANDGVSHKDFVDGVNSGAMGFKVMFGEPSKLLYGSRKTMFTIFVMLYMAVPIIAIPLLAYHADNWWLLFGIPFSYLFTYFATWANNKYSGKWKSNMIYYFLIFCIVYWIRNGFHFYDYATFFFFCSLWGTFFFKVADQVQFDYALQLLKEDTKLFNLAIEENQILIIRKDEEDKKRNEQINEDNAMKLLRIADDKYEKEDYAGAIEYYTKSISYYPFSSAFSKRADSKMELKDFEGAIEDYTNCIQRMPAIPNKLSFSITYRSRGEAKIKLGLTNEAESDFIESTKLMNS